ncbi:MAG: DUF2877 domain-containing protein [Frankiaceae bacterium]
MTAAAPTHPGRPAAALPGAASVAIRDLLTGPPRAAIVGGVTPHACYVEAGDALVAVTLGTASRMPCAVRLPPGAPPPGSWARAGEAAVVGAGAVTLPRRVVAVRRWWSPVPALPPVDPAALAGWRSAVAAEAATAGRGGRGTTAGGAGTAGGVADPAVAGLAAALLAGDPAAAAGAVGALLGRGPGSTPAGDDVVAGALVTLRLLGAVLPGGGQPAVLTAVAERTVALAPARTTRLSAALLRHAAAGEPLGELADVLATVGAKRPVGPAVATLLAVGHTSGSDLLTGLLLACDALSRWGRRDGEVHG